MSTRTFFVTGRIVPFYFILVMVRVKIVFLESMKGTSFVSFFDRWMLVDKWLRWVLSLEFNKRLS
jgi:hypothetical protein